MVLLQLKEPFELFLRSSLVHYISRFLSYGVVTLAVESNVETNSFLSCSFHEQCMYITRKSLAQLTAII